MQAQTRAAIREAAAIIEDALQQARCDQSVELVEQGCAIRIGTFDAHLIVRYQEGLWRVQEHTPYLQRTMAYDTLEECARDLALCKPGVLFYQSVHTGPAADASHEEPEELHQQMVGMS
jgi:hypothetical protein